MKSVSRSALFVVAACAAIARSSDAFQVVMMAPLRSPPSGLSMSRSDGVEASRRLAIGSAFGFAASAAAAAVLVATTASSPQAAWALDMDSFVNSQVRTAGGLGNPTRVRRLALITYTPNPLLSLLLAPPINASLARGGHEELRPQEGSQVPAQAHRGRGAVQVRAERRGEGRGVQALQGFGRGAAGGGGAGEEPGRGVRHVNNKELVRANDPRREPPSVATDKIRFQ
jgi:hypothetical protein